MNNKILQVDYDYLDELSNIIAYDNRKLFNEGKVVIDTKSTISANQRYQEISETIKEIKNKIILQIEEDAADIGKYGITFEETERELVPIA